MFYNRQSKRKMSLSTYKPLLLPSIMLLLSMVLLAGSSLAWFSANKEVDANGMTTSVDVSPNLVIVKGDGNINTATASQMSVDFTSTVVVLTPATHDWDVGTTTGLKYVTNPKDVSESTGKAKTDKTITFGAAVNGTSQYYVDYTVKVASHGKALTVSSFYATISTSTSPLKNYQNAATVDFYVGSVSSSNYMGNINLLTASTGKVELKSKLSSNTIPLNTSGSVTIIMRVYYDGALQDTSASNACYIRTNNISTANLTLNVQFTAVD